VFSSIALNRLNLQTPYPVLRAFHQAPAEDFAEDEFLSIAFSEDRCLFSTVCILQIRKTGWMTTAHCFKRRKRPCSNRSGTTGGFAMVKDDRDILELLKEELDFIEKGGYGRSVRTAWQPKSTFQDSLTCINYGYPYRAHPCNECHLLDFVAPEDQAKDVPCHFIHLNERGETIEDLENEDNQAKLEKEIKQWLRKKIGEIENSRAT
jgi:hypothetical protein